jgi:type III secretory pathway component EscU
MNNPMNAGQYPQTQAVVALVLSVVGLMMCGLCTAVPGVIMANTALGTTKQYPGHPDQGLAKAAQIVGWITIGLWIVIIGFYLLMFVVVIAAEA